MTATKPTNVKAWPKIICSIGLKKRGLPRWSHCKGIREQSDGCWNGRKEKTETRNWRLLRCQRMRPSSCSEQSWHSLEIGSSSSRRQCCWGQWPNWPRWPSWSPVEPLRCWNGSKARSCSCMWMESKSIKTNHCWLIAHWGDITLYFWCLLR